MSVFVKRIGNPRGDKQLWMLMGGPGAAGAGDEGNASAFADADPNLVVYLPDHRGTGRSTRLGCPVQEAAGSPAGLTITADEWPACLVAIDAVWGSALDHLGTSEAARDVGWLVQELRGTQAVHVFGSSYGTYWGHRYLQIHPDQPDSLSLLGIAPPGFDFTVFTEQYDEAGRRFMDRCSSDPFCASRLGPDARAVTEAVMNQVDAGLCPGALAAGLDRATLKLYFSALLSWSGPQRAFIPAIVYRLARCSAADVAALQAAAPQMADPLSGLLGDPLFSAALNQHVSLSEMWHPPVPTLEQAQQAAADAIFGLGSTEGRVLLSPTWPTYPHDEFVLNYAQSDVPMLMMVGEFDPNSPIELGEDFATHFGGIHQHFLEIPDGNHGFHSPTAQGYGCAINVMFNFIQDPTGPLLDCMDDVVPIAFEGSAGMAQGLFGTQDLYD
ncbi:MAG: alpha/beta hydrolase [Deltaproteobacteria bacterium]|nr:alpha/beta hydrolase [Deltaproteobacteria bacterium]